MDSEQQATANSFFNLTWKIAAMKNGLNGIAMNLSEFSEEYYHGEILVIYLNGQEMKISLVKGTYNFKPMLNDGTIAEIFSMFGNNVPDMIRNYYQIGELNVLNYVQVLKTFKYCTSIIGKISQNGKDFPVCLVVNPDFQKFEASFSITFLFSNLIKDANEEFASCIFNAIMIAIAPETKDTEQMILSFLDVLIGIEPTTKFQMQIDSLLTQSFIDEAYERWTGSEDADSVAGIFAPTLDRGVIYSRHALRKVWDKSRSFNLFEAFKFVGY